MTRDDERLVLRMDLLDEFPEGVPKWMEFLPVADCRRNMTLRREGYTTLGFDPAEDELESRVLH